MEKEEKKKKMVHKNTFISFKFNLLAFCLFILKGKKEEKWKKRKKEEKWKLHFVVLVYFFIKC